MDCEEGFGRQEEKLILPHLVENREVVLPSIPNRLYYGDNLEIMKSLLAEHPQGFVDLIYIDPPFNSKRNYNILYEEALRKLPKEFTMAQMRSYCFGVSDKTISNVLAEHKKEGKVRCLGKGRHAVWEKSV